MSLGIKGSAEGIDSIKECCESTPNYLVGLVKWFDQDKGFGFILIGSPERDAFLHARTLEAIGEAVPSQGDRISCELMNGEKGLQVERVIAIERVSIDAPSQNKESVQFVAKVKFYAIDKGFGFVQNEDGVEAFVGSKLLRKLNLAPLRSEQKVRVSASLRERGLVVETLTFVLDREPPQNSNS